MAREGFRHLDKTAQEKRDRYILRLRAKGLTLKQIAAQVRLSDTTVYEILHQAEAKLPQT